MRVHHANNRPSFAMCSGPDASHWMHTVTIHPTYGKAVEAYNKVGGTWSAVIIRNEDGPFTPGRRVLKRANQYNYGHAAAWCDEVNRRIAAGVQTPVEA